MGNPEPQVYFTWQPAKDSSNQEPEIWEEAREMAQQIGVVDSLEKGLGLVPSTHIGPLTNHQ